MNTVFCSNHVDEALENGPGFYLGLKFYVLYTELGLYFLKNNRASLDPIRENMA